jgi:hypothetical protein
VQPEVRDCITSSPAFSNRFDGPFTRVDEKTETQYPLHTLTGGDSDLSDEFNGRDTSARNKNDVMPDRIGIEAARIETARRARGTRKRSVARTSSTLIAYARLRTIHCHSNTQQPPPPEEINSESEWAVTKVRASRLHGKTKTLQYHRVARLRPRRDLLSCEELQELGGDAGRLPQAIPRRRRATEAPLEPHTTLVNALQRRP